MLSGTSNQRATLPGMANMERANDTVIVEETPPWSINKWGVAGILLLGAALAVTSLVRDSRTFDETSHLTAGMSYWMTGDFRLTPDHPPLAQLWAAWPLLFVDNHWVDDPPGWVEANVWTVGMNWLASPAYAHRLLVIARCAMLTLLMGLWVTVYVIATRLFGRGAGYLGLALAVLSPTLLAHGRLVTTDVPAALVFFLAIVSFDAVLARITIGTIAAASLSFAASALTKFSWFLLLPVFAVMVAMAVIGRASIRWELPPILRRLPPFVRFASGALDRRTRRAAAVLGILLIEAAVAYGAIWSCYGWRYSPYRTIVPGQGLAESASTEPNREMTAESEWSRALSDASGRSLQTPVAGLLRLARRNRWLPEAYLFGLAYLNRSALERDAYFCGRYSPTGWLLYFPVALLIKTPIPILILVSTGFAALVRYHRDLGQNARLLTGLIVFTVLFGAVSVLSRLNIGLRHLLPVYPVMFSLAAASALWWRHRAGRIVIVACLGWLIVGDAYVHPQYLSYFNESVGGPAQGYRFLADSNLDWGQDLIRLREYLNRQDEGKIKLAYFGSTYPQSYGIDTEDLMSSFPVAPPARLTAGTYVLSETQWLGVYDAPARPAFWEDPRQKAEYARLHDLVRDMEDGDPGSGGNGHAQGIRAAWDRWSRYRLISRLRNRTADARIGYSLRLYRLTASDVAALVAP